MSSDMNGAESPNPASFSLDARANDTSLALDLLRILAAQMVCVGHGWNLFIGSGSTYLPHIGVMLFFVLSGFVIAHTLVERQRREEYGLGEFLIERFSRIYAAYLPALVIIGMVDCAMYAAGRFPDANSLSWTIFWRNLAMLQNYPGPFDLGVPTFGSAGQISSIATEFHIYCFIGALFFCFINRGRRLSLLVAILSASMPLAYFSAIPGSDRSLFVLWLMGFAVYFVARHIQLDAEGKRLSAIACFGLILYWLHVREPGNEYDIKHYPIFVLIFMLFVLTTQRTKYLAASMAAGRTITFLAAYAFSLFLLHYTFMKVLRAFWTGGPVSGAIVAFFASNVLAVGFAYFTEFRYRRLSAYLKRTILRRRNVSSFDRGAIGNDDDVLKLGSQAHILRKTGK